MALLFPLQFRRQYAAPIDEDLVFGTVLALNNYLTNGRRYSGQIVSCLETEGVIYVLSGDKASWIMINMPEAGTKDYIVIETLFERDALPEQLRRIGLLVYVVEEDKEYRLTGGIENSYWNEIAFDDNIWTNLDW